MNFELLRLTGAVFTIEQATNLVELILRTHGHKPVDSDAETIAREVFPEVEPGRVTTNSITVTESNFWTVAREVMYPADLEELFNAADYVPSDDQASHAVITGFEAVEERLRLIGDDEYVQQAPELFDLVTIARTLLTHTRAIYEGEVSRR